MNKQTGEGEIVILLIIAVLVYLIWIAISFAWHFVSTFPSTEQLSAQQSLAKSIGVPFNQYIANACELEKVCQRYNNVRRECATAGSIKECIKIKMGNTDYSACEGGTFFLKTHREQSMCYPHTISAFLIKLVDYLSLMGEMKKKIRLTIIHLFQLIEFFRQMLPLTPPKEMCGIGGNAAN